jgi:hypothetical protein
MPAKTRLNAAAYSPEMTWTAAIMTWQKKQGMSYYAI